MNRFFIYLIVLFFQFAPFVRAEIIQTSTLAPIKEAIEKADEKTLVVFDVDEVIIVPKDQILQPQYKKRRQGLKKDLISHTSSADKKKLLSVVRLERENNLVDPEIVSLIKQAQSKTKVVALTHSKTGSQGKIPSREVWLINVLESFGVNFKASWVEVPDQKLDINDISRVPTFQAGILFTDKIPKGKVLESFIKKILLRKVDGDKDHKIPLHINKVIFVDNKHNNLDSVKEMCDQLGIEYIGFYYTAVADRPVVPLNEKRVLLQWDVLEKEENWLSDAKADERLKKAP